MPKCIIDGREVEFSPGENLVEIAKRVGITIPVFCYHPGLTVVAQCRMCAVQVEKMPKLQTACSTKAAEGMVVHTQSDPVKKAREYADRARLEISVLKNSPAKQSLQLLLDYILDRNR